MSYGSVINFKQQLVQQTSLAALPPLPRLGGIARLQPREVHLTSASRQQLQQVTMLAAAQVPVVVEYDLQKDVRSSWCSR